MALTSLQWLRWVVKPIVFTLALVPLLALIWWGYRGQLGANPVETITFHTGEWGLRLLFVTLAITPLRRLTGWNWLQRFRRMLGLFAFFYVCLHFATFVVFDHFFDLQGIWEDVIKRPYITVGFLAFVFLIPLAITSTKGMMRRLGRNWQRLHRLIYPIGILAVLHFLWLVKANNVLEPLIYAAILILLLGFRLWFYYRRVGSSKGTTSLVSS